jgi:quercetin dioxygenase-like cupin family protein
MKKLIRLITAALFATAISTVAAQTTMAQDPVTVDAKHYKVEFENDQVRVLRVNYGPKEKSVMHRHPAGVAIFVTDAHSKFTFSDGKTEERHSKAGEVMWTPAGSHLPESLGDKPFEVIVVELKGGKAAAKSAPAPAEDAVKADAKHHKVEFENAEVRVLRANVGPHGKTLMHGHPANVVIFLTDGHVKSTSPDGKAEESQVKAGQVAWREQVKHESENLSDRLVEVIVVELKAR